ncbi:MAG: hypothetical protein PVJ31_01590, partial [Methyloceanibacter sp.]
YLRLLDLRLSIWQPSVGQPSICSLLGPQSPAKGFSYGDFLSQGKEKIDSDEVITNRALYT